MAELLSDVWSVVWMVFIIFVYIAWLMVLFNIIIDLFRDREMSGLGKAIWMLLLIAVPLVTSVIYLIIRGGGMSRRAAEQVSAQQAAVDERIRSVAGANPAAEIAQAKSLLDAGAITAAEYAAIKARALA